MLEKPDLKLRDNPRLFVGPEAWALLGGQEIWLAVYKAVYFDHNVSDVLFENLPELIAFDLMSNHFIEADREQGGKAWAKRVAWWDNTVAQREQVENEFRPAYESLRQRLENRNA